MDSTDAQAQLPTALLQQIAAAVQTPCYVYQEAQIAIAWQLLQQAFALAGYPYQLFYAVKANANLSVLRYLHTLGSGFDVVSAGEIARVVQAVGSAAKVVFSGVGKTKDELLYALRSGIAYFNIESATELAVLADCCAQTQQSARFGLRWNPDIALPDSHPYITTGAGHNKFGLPTDAILQLYQARPYLTPVGISVHLGSQITDIAPFETLVASLLQLKQQLQARGAQLHHLNVGGGLGISYDGRPVLLPQQYAAVFAPLLADTPLTLHFEPGRYLVAHAGLLLTRVEYLKVTQTQQLAIIDCGMNDLLRPALYGSTHRIVPIHLQHAQSALPRQQYHVVGPVCESGDSFGRQHALPPLTRGDLLAILDVGAYGFSMSSNYNSRPRAAEVWLDAEGWRIIRQRETYQHLFQLEL